MNKVEIAVIPVAGYGTRFLPYTKSVPKPMLPIINRPSIEIIAKEAADSGIKEIVFIVGHKQQIIENYFSPCPELEEVLVKQGKSESIDTIKYCETFAKVDFVVQKEQRGTADAILAAEKFVSGRPFAVLFGDDVMYNDGKPVLKQLIDCFSKTGKTVIGVNEVPHSEVPKYASVEYDKVCDREYSVTQITEKPPLNLVKSDLAPLGRYVCSPTVFDHMRRLKPSVNGEYQFTDALDMEAKTVGAIAYDFEGTRYDIGDRFGFLKANIEFGLRDEGLKARLKEYLSDLAEKIDQI